MRKRYDDCDETCTVDCGHCKGNRPPAQMGSSTDAAGMSGQYASDIDQQGETS